MIRKKLKKENLQKEPYLLWNACIELISTEDENDLTEKQKIAHHSFIYDSEIQNGGHLQFFENEFKEDYSEIIKSLKIIGAFKQSEILENAINQFFGKGRTKIIDKGEFIRSALDGEYEKLDNVYYEIEPTINNYLEKYFRENVEEFIEFIN